MKYYLAIDIGASSGRHILGYMDNNQIIIEEMYRFTNEMIEKDGHKYWDIDYLFDEVKKGIKACVTAGKIPVTLGIDTWAVDYVLLDHNQHRLQDIYAYRDLRVDKYIPEYFEVIEFDRIFELTGIQYQKFNTIYQLKSDNKEVKEKANHFLMIPDYLHYQLSNQMVNEYTNLTSTQLFDIKENRLSTELLDASEVNHSMFEKIVKPGTSIGNLSDEMTNELGLKSEIIVPPTHDTASAFMASVGEDSIIISSGTWSLMGVEINSPILSQDAQKANFTNEGGYEGYRFLKNIMGLWIIQEVSRMYAKRYTFDELVRLAYKHPFDGVFDVNDERFLNPQNMIEEIKEYFQERNQTVPTSVGEITYCVYNSLACSYQKTVDEIEQITHKSYSLINVVGGGCKNKLLNEMIAEKTGKTVLAGPVEATALGNLLSQMIAKGEVKDLQEGRNIIRNSFQISEYYKGGKDENEEQI